MAIKRPWNRAKIFQPFDALPGLRELLREKEREHEARYDAIGNESEEGDEDVEIPLASDTLLDYDESNQKFQREEMTFMEFHANDEHVYLTNERGELLANADFRETAPGIFDIYHTVVLPELRGQGIAAKLVRRPWKRFTGAAARSRQRARTPKHGWNAIRRRRIRSHETFCHHL